LVPLEEFPVVKSRTFPIIIIRGGSYPPEPPSYCRPSCRTAALRVAVLKRRPSAGNPDLCDRRTHFPGNFTDPPMRMF
jgi:hypothetical protein